MIEQVREFQGLYRRGKPSLRKSQRVVHYTSVDPIEFSRDNGNLSLPLACGSEDYHTLFSPFIDRVTCTECKERAGES